MSSLRNFPEQFEQGCDISPSRIERNLDALLSALNVVKLHTQAARLVETNMVLGYQPSTTAGLPTLPFLSAYNNVALAASTLEPPTTFQNPWRHKATGIPGDAVPELGTGNLWTWETSWVTTDPTMLKALTVLMATDSTYNNVFQYGAAPPTGKNVGQSSDDWAVQVFVDSALNSEDRRNNTVEQVWTGRAATPFQLSYFAPLAAWDTLQPQHPSDGVNGLFIQLGVFTYLPAGSRVRVAITVPQHIAAAASSWGLTPYAEQVLSVTATLLESR